MVRVRRAVAVVTVASLVLLAVAPPASAHTRAAAASSYDSRVTAAPDAPGVTWRTYAGGDLLEVTATGGVELAVLGYEGEPYVRITRDGVEVNLNSPATYLNSERYADVAVPPRADPAAAPHWRHLSTAPTHAWHDHRVHWMAPTPPPSVREAPGRLQLVLHWSVPLVVDGEPDELVGELWWVPGGSALPWLLGALVGSAAALLGLRRGEGKWDHLARTRASLRPAAGVVAAVALLNVIHFVDELTAWPAPTLDILFGVLHTAMFVGVGIGGALLAWRGTQGPFLSLGIGSGAVLFHQGLLQWRLLTESQLPTVWPAPLLRAAVALSIAQALWVALVIAVAMRGEARSDEPSTADIAPRTDTEPAPAS